MLEETSGPQSSTTAIVVGFDARSESRIALAAATDLAQRLAAHLYVVHAVDIHDYPIDPDSTDWEDQLKAALSAERNTARSLLEDAHVAWTYQAWRRDPVNSLIQVANDVDALMIVVGVREHGWKGHVERLVAPSVSRHLINRANRPVLIVAHEDM